MRAVREGRDPGGITKVQTNQKLIMQHYIRTDAGFYKKRLKDLIQMHKSFRIL